MQRRGTGPTVIMKLHTIPPYEQNHFIVAGAEQRINGETQLTHFEMVIKSSLLNNLMPSGTTMTE